MKKDVHKNIIVRGMSEKNLGRTRRDEEDEEGEESGTNKNDLQ